MENNAGMIVLWLVLLYTYVHFFIMFFVKTRPQLTTYEKVVSIIATAWLGLTMLWIMFP